MPVLLYMYSIVHEVPENRLTTLNLKQRKPHYRSEATNPNTRYLFNFSRKSKVPEEQHSPMAIVHVTSGGTGTSFMLVCISVHALTPCCHY